MTVLSTILGIVFGVAFLVFVLMLDPVEIVMTWREIRDGE